MQLFLKEAKIKGLLLTFFACISLLSVTSQSGVIASNDNVYNIQEQVQEAEEAAHFRTSEYVPDEIIIKFRETVADSIEEQLELKKPAGQLKLSTGLDELNARHRAKEIKPLFKNFKNKRQQVEALLRKDKTFLTKREEHIIRRLKRARKGAKVPDLNRIYKIKVELEPGQSLEEVVKAYDNDPDVEYAELNYIVSIDTTPNDPLYSVQWSLNNTGQMYPESGDYNHPPGTPGCDIDAPQAWDIHIGSSNIIVAVADTGIDYTHRDINNNMWTDPSGYHGYDFVNSDNYPMDDHGHGTHCAGIVAAESNNSVDIAGVCWNVKIMALKFLDEYGSGTYTNAADAFYYAVNNGADVISNSWSKSEYSQTMQDAIDYAYSQGVIIVGSAGNNNLNSPRYPANNDHVISVAATNSNDEKATFSNYGDWVDIAAPGVDILSLRAGGSDAGTPYNNYTTIMSGTSMSCPYVSAACALVISKSPSLTVDEVENILLVEIDPIVTGICISNGRLNIQKALKIINFDRNYYTCLNSPNIRLIDFDLEGEPNALVTLETDGGDHETVTVESSTWPWLFEYIATMEVGAPVIEDGILQISHGQTITVIYEDDDDGTGNPSTETDSALIDCQEPIISNVQMETITCMSAVVTFETNELSVSNIKCGLDCNEPYTIEGVGLELTTSHTIYLEELTSQTDYFFIIEAKDIAGNQTIDDVNGLCFQFSTTLSPVEIHVPYDYPTIQEAIDSAAGCTTIVVEDGIYRGEGNRDIDFKGKVITVKSANGPDNCIIDCQGSASDPHRGFYFQNYEDRRSILDGFTIINGYAENKGGGIACYIGSPTIQNCIISNNHAGKRTQYHCGGGGIGTLYSEPKIINCIVSDNVSYNRGGILIESGDVEIINCKIERNIAYYVSSMGTFSYGGGIYFSGHNLLLKNSLIADNWSDESSGGIACKGGSAKFANIVNCTIVNNGAGRVYGGVGRYKNINLSLTNCIVWGNEAPTTPQLPNSTPVSYSNVEGGYPGTGNINLEPHFADEAGYDYHLKSKAGRWDPSIESWILDDVTSPCIDAGNPGCPLGGELSDPNNIRINMGAYGGKWQASKTPAGWSLSADLTNDGIVDISDLTEFALYLLANGDCIPSDLDHNQAADLSDFARFTCDWLQNTTWY